MLNLVIAVAVLYVLTFALIVPVHIFIKRNWSNFKND